MDIKSNIYLGIDIGRNMGLSLYIDDDIYLQKNRKIVSTTIKNTNTQNIISNINSFVLKSGKLWGFDDLNIKEYGINIITCTSHKKFYNSILSHGKLFGVLEYFFKDIIYLNEKKINKNIFGDGNIKKEDVSKKIKDFLKQNNIEHIIYGKETLDGIDSIKFILGFLKINLSK